MASTSGATSGKRSWQQAQRPVFDEHSQKVWRWLITILALVMIALAIYLWWPTLPSQTLLVSITDDRKEFATVPPVPMLEQDEAALKVWAQATRVPILLRKLDALQSVSTFCTNLFSVTEPFEFETLDDADQPKLSQRVLRKDDTLVIYVRAHGVAVLPGKDDNGQPQPYLVTSFEGLEDLTPQNSISVAELLKSLAARPDIKTVVVLDAVHFNYDPRLGQLVNEFPTAVANAIPAAAPNLWVILPTSTGELSVVSPQHERTLFSLALLDSWQAEKAGGPRVPMPKFLELVRDRYKRIREDEADLEFWQSLKQLPAAVTATKERPDPTGAAVFLPTIPKPKKKTQDEEPVVPPAKKTTSSAGRDLHLPNPLATSLAIAYQPPTATPSSTTPVAPGPAATNPPASTPPPATPNPAASPTPAPPATADPAPPLRTPAPIAAPDADAPPRHRPFLVEYAKLLEQAWRVRDELENWRQTSGSQGWSPIHFAPHQWRKLNAYLVAYEERCRAGTARDNQQLQIDLGILIGDLERLKAQLQNADDPRDAGTNDMFDLSGAWKRFRFGNLGDPSFAWQTFQASPQNALHDANQALKTYADAAYRMPDYVRLQGLMLSSPGVTLTIKTDLTRLADRLEVMRIDLQAKTEDWRIQPHIATGLQARAKEVQNAREALDRKLVTFAKQLSANPGVALPGRGQAICLLLESPLLRAGERAALLDRVLPPLASSTPANIVRRAAGGQAGDGSLLLTSMQGQVRAEMDVIKLLSGEEKEKGTPKSDGTLAGSARFFLSRMNELSAHSSATRADLGTALGSEFREFLGQLPNRITAKEKTLSKVQERQRARDLFELYHWLLLVDGRDAGRLNQIPVYLTQPFLAEPAVDSVKVTLEPKQIFLSDKPQRVQVLIQLTTDKVNPADLKVLLSLNQEANLLEVIDAEARSATTKNREVYIGGSKEWRRTFEVKAIGVTNQPSLTLTADVAFGKQTAQDNLECRLKPPNEIELKVVAEHRWSEAEPFANAETNNKLGAELRLYPNRSTALKFILRNLAGETKKVRVQLVHPKAPDHVRFFDERRELLPKWQDLDSQIRKMTSGLPPQIAGRVIAESSEKTPIELPHAGSPPVAVNLELKLPPADPANPTAERDLDVTGGLICIISNVENPSERFVRWLDLRPYAPHELYKVDQFTYANGKLGFQVRLISQDLATGMQLGDPPLKAVWDRSDKRFQPATSIEMMIPPGKLLAQFQGEVPANVRSLIVPLHIDGYPRALIYGLQITPGGVIAQNLKQDTLAGVHVGRLTHEKQMFLIQKPNSPFTPLTAPDEPPDLVTQTLIRKSDEVPALIKLDSRATKQRLTFDLQADITAAAFAKGASIDLGQEGQEPFKRLYHDRDIHVKLVSTATNGVLVFETTVDDFRNLPFDVETDPQDDTRVSLLAAVRGNSELASPDAVHSLPIIFDRKPPHTIKGVLQTPRIVVNPRVDTPIIADVQVTDGNGAGLQSVKISLVPKRGLLPMGDAPKGIVLDVINNPGEAFRVTRSVPEGLPLGVHEFNLEIEPLDLVGRVGTPLLLPLTIEVPKPKDRKPLQLGPLFADDAKKLTDDAKARKKMDDDAKMMKALQGPAGS